jgi:glucuronosyltransferase
MSGRQKITHFLLVQVDSLFDLTEMNFGDMMNFLYNTIGIATTEHAMKNEKVQEFIHRNNDKFDLIIAEQFYQEAFLMLAHKYSAPIVTIGKQVLPSTC